MKSCGCDFCNDLRNIEPAKYIGGGDKELQKFLKEADDKKQFIYHFIDGEEIDRIDRFEFKGVTLLGESRRPAIYKANAELINFSQKVEEVNSMYFAMSSIKINNSKEASIKSQSWNNPRKKIIF